MIHSIYYFDIKYDNVYHNVDIKMDVTDIRFKCVVLRISERGLMCTGNISGISDIIDTSHNCDGHDDTLKIIGVDLV